MPVQLLVLMAQVTRTEPFSGQLFYRGQLSPCTLTFHHLHAPPSYFSSLLCPSVIFLVRSHSSCVSIKEGGHGGGSEGARNRRVSQHGSVSFINIRFSQRDALKANSETSLPAQQTKSPAPPSLFVPLSPFTNRYLSESDCTG